MKIYRSFVICLCFLACNEVEESQKEEVLKPIKYGKVAKTDGTQVRTFNGTSKAGLETKLSFRANGLIVNLSVKVGDRVRRGQLLAQLDQKDMQLGLDQARSSMQSAQIQMNTSKSNLDRVKELYQASSASLSDYEQAKNAFAGSATQYENAKKAVDLQRSQLEYAKIYAPNRGVVTAVNNEINEIVQAGSPVVIINSDQGDIEVNVGVPEAYITQIKRGSEVTVDFPAIPGKEYSGRITEVGFSTGGNATYPVILKLLKAGDEIRPEMPAEVHFRFGEAKSNAQLRVPVKALGEDHEGSFVFSLQEEGEKVYVAKKTLIKVGELHDNGFVVLSGVDEGTLVATAGLRSLYDGRKVTLLD